jgi:hypothetical protein
MQKKIFTLVNKGMNRDLSISKAGESSAFENHNIRILAREHDTALSVTNERGNKEISLSGSIVGTLIGWNVLNNRIVLFTHESSGNEPDHIYRIDYGRGETFEYHLLYTGDLNFDDEHPIESVVYYEAEDIQKIYWVDGLNVLRMMNFMAGQDEIAKWNQEVVSGVHKTTWFDSNRAVKFTASVDISKDNAGNARDNGVAQYFLTYYNKHGQESGFAWVSDLVYLSPFDKGGSADGKNNNRVILNVSNLDTRFEYFRIYSVVRTSYDIAQAAYLVAECKIASNVITVIDDGANQETIDVTSLLYKGSQDFVPGTIEHKDQVLFLGDLDLKKASYSKLENAIRKYMLSPVGTDYIDGQKYESACIQFILSDSNDASGLIDDIDNPDHATLYSYNNQLVNTSSEITSFKGNEKYRFALAFCTANGIQTEAFWIGDATNTLYPVMDSTNHVIKRVVAQCTIPAQVVNEMVDAGFATAKLMIAQATDSDRSVKAQGIINPTVFNVWNRFNDRVYGASSWLTRPRGSNVANRHFDVIRKSTESTGEIECNYWENTEPTPYYVLTGDAGELPVSVDSKYDGEADYSRVMLIYKIWMNRFGVQFLAPWRLYVDVYYAKVSQLAESGGETALNNYDIPASSFSYSGVDYPDPNGKFVLNTKLAISADNSQDNYDNCIKYVWNKITDSLLNEYQFPDQAIASFDMFKSWVDENVNRRVDYFYNPRFPERDEHFSSLYNAANFIWDDSAPSGSTENDKWYILSLTSRSDKTAERDAIFKKHLMFVDENLVTLDSPEIAYESVSFDNVDKYKLRIVGAAKIGSCISDYDVDITHALLPGENLVHQDFSGDINTGYLDGIVSWPLWKEYGLKAISEGFPDDIHDATSANYTKPGSDVVYWLHMWQRIGKVDSFTGEEETDESVLRTKTFANLRYFSDTIYDANSHWKEYDNVKLRIFNYTSSQYVGIDIKDRRRNYNAVIDDSLMPPGEFKYPVLYSRSEQTPGSGSPSYSSYLYSNLPVRISYSSNPHAVIALKSDVIEGLDGSKYVQDILPYVKDVDQMMYFPAHHDDTTHSYSGALLPWIEVGSANEDEDYVVGVVKYLDLDLPEMTVVSYNSYGKQGWFELRESSIQSEDPGEELMLYYQAIVIASAHFGSASMYCRFTGSDGRIYLADLSAVILNEHYLEFSGVNVKYAINPLTQTQKFNADYVSYPDGIDNPELSSEAYGTFELATGEQAASADYPYLDYDVNQEEFNLVPNNLSSNIVSGDQYLLIGEIYYDFDAETTDMRYGGPYLSAVENNRFISAGPSYSLAGLQKNTTFSLYANNGDTYFQRWDALRTKPYFSSSANNVIDIASVMLETHINIDGRTDNQRGFNEVASIDIAQFNTLNRVYSQPDNFSTRRDLDSDFNRSEYHSSVSWTLEKHDMDEIDEWTHQTLASTLNLDGDKGPCNAIRRFRNSLIAFQDRGIAEILFNSRTQLTTTDGVPVEIANSGKVDGKRYVTNKYGCVNKWSIVEGKDALYFIDNINKMFGSIGENGIDNLSSRLGFSAFFRKINNVASWTPKNFENVVSYYDHIHSDVYLVRKDTNGEESCLVYSEPLGVFSSFFDYDSVPMMTTVEDAFVSFKNGKLWLQNKGFYCNFFGTQHDFWMTYRATPDPYGDKLWTNLEYRADFYEVIKANGTEDVVEGDLISDDCYLANKTFDKLSVWDEFQHTGDVDIPNGDVDAYSDVRKKFRIWRMDIPRAVATETNKYGFDRIRNPWANIKLKKHMLSANGDYRDLAQIHDINVIYYE